MDLKTIGNLGLIDIFACGFFACIEVLETEKRCVRFPDKEEEYEDLEDQRYICRRIPPRDFLIPKGCRLLDLSDVPYLAVAFYPTVAELKDDAKFDLPEDIENFPEAEQSDAGKTYREVAKMGIPYKDKMKETDPDFKRIGLWEIHDRVNQKLIYMTHHQDKVVAEIDWPVKFKIEGRSLYPITVMAMNQSPDQWYPKPEIDLIAPQLIMLNKIDMMIYQDAGEKWRKYATIAGLLPSEQAAKLTDQTLVNAVIEVDRDTIDQLAGDQPHSMPDMKDLVVPITDPAPKRDLIPVREMIKQEIQDILGYGPPASGGMPKTRSAREAIAIKERMEQRMSKRSDAIADFYRLFGQKHIKFLQQTMVLERYVRVFSDAKTLAEWRQYGVDEIQGNFNFIVYAGSSMPRTTEAKRNSEKELFQTLLPAVQMGLPLEPIVLRLAEAYQWRGVDQLLRNYKPLVKKMAMVLGALKMQPGKVPPGALPEVAAGVVQAILTQEEIGMIAKEISGQRGGKPGTQMQGGVPTAPRGDPRPGHTDTGTM
jgi:hypothetical protein